jgi:hypothetical protein
MLRFVTIHKFAELSGYTPAAINTKIRDGIWPEGDVWIKAPDNRNLINVEGYEKWVVAGAELKVHRKPVSKSRSCIVASGAGKESRSSPPPLT